MPPCGSPRASAEVVASRRRTSPRCWGRPGSRTRWRCAPACPAWPPGSPGRRSAATSCSSRPPRTPGKGRLILTGQLGDVMKESAQAALSLVKTARAGLGIDPAQFENSDIHIHVPAGATPKDGPSAGVAMFIGTRLAADRPHGARRHRDDRRDQPARAGAAGGRHQGKGGGRRRRRFQTGDAARAQPARLEEIPQEARDRLEFIWLDRVDNAVAAALAPASAMAQAQQQVPVAAVHE